MLNDFDWADNLVLLSEGGYVNRASDPGGPTNLGVTIGTAQALHLDINHDGTVDILDIKAMTKADAAKVYKHYYWDSVSADSLAAGLDYAVFDFSVNSGCGRAARYLQQILGMTGADVDGVIGPKTLALAAQRKSTDLINAVCDWRLTFLEHLPTFAEYGPGWKNRVASVRAASLARATGVQVALPSLSPPRRCPQALPRRPRLPSRPLPGLAQRRA